MTFHRDVSDLVNSGELKMVKAGQNPESAELSPGIRLKPDEYGVCRIE